MIVVGVFDGLSPDAVRALEASGWTRDRRVPIDGWTQVLGREGYHLSDVAAEVLRSLGGLRARPLVKGPLSAPLLFEPVLAGGGALDISEEFEARFGQRFYPIAEWISNACVFTGDAGKVVSYDDIEKLDVADTFSEAMDVILLSARQPGVVS